MILVNFVLFQNITDIARTAMTKPCNWTAKVRTRNRVEEVVFVR